MEHDPLIKILTSTPKGKAATEKLLAMHPNQEEISPQSVYKAGSREARMLCNDFVPYLLLPGSRLIGSEHLKKLYDLSQAGHSCLLLLEHYGNFDMPMFAYQTDNDPLLGPDFADHFVSIAGVKLSQDNAFISAYVQSYNRLIIWPSRGYDKMNDEQKKEMMALNMASMKELTARKYKGQMFLVFPSGTRIRPWAPDTRKGVREIASYVKSFQYLCFVSMNGNVLPVDENDSNLSADKPRPDVLLFTASEVVSSKDYLAECNQSLPEGGDVKAHIVGCVMDKLLAMHEAGQPIYEAEMAKHKGP